MGYSLVEGWRAAYPETTGYVIGTLLEYASRHPAPDLPVRAREMGDWETAVQAPDGGVTQGAIGSTPVRSIVFNTGMVLHGWIDLRDTEGDRYDEPAARAIEFLVGNLRHDGTWSEAVEYSSIPHAYNARVAWAMLRWADATADDGARHAAERHLEWVLGRQRPNGWFDDCVFKPGTQPSTHGIAYTLRGLLESQALTGESRYLDAVLCTSEVLIRKLEVLGYLPANFDEDWRPAARHACLTGTVQLGGVWLRLFQIGGDDRYLNAGLKAIDLAARRQERGPWRATRGALAGSFPVWGRYAPLQYPNWAAKFLADALMLRDDCLAI